jgi:hypothetical protein
MSMKLRKPKSTQLALKWIELLQRSSREREDERTARSDLVQRFTSGGVLVPR